MDGAPYRDSTGFQCRIAVEWSLCQRIPLSEPKVDAREDTILKDEGYLHFLAELTVATPG